MPYILAKSIGECPFWVIHEQKYSLFQREYLGSEVNEEETYDLSQQLSELDYYGIVVIWFHVYLLKTEMFLNCVTGR